MTTLSGRREMFFFPEVSPGKLSSYVQMIKKLLNKNIYGPELTTLGCNYETQGNFFGLHGSSRGHERPYLCFGRYFHLVAWVLRTLNGPLGSTRAGVGRLIVRVFPSLAIYLSTWLKSIRLAMSSSPDGWRL
jgi:hypothetical protein